MNTKLRNETKAHAVELFLPDLIALEILGDGE